MPSCTVLLGTHSLALSHAHQVLTVSDMESFISEHGKPKYGAAKTRTQKMNCDMLVHRKNQLVRQLTQLERPRAPMPNGGADGAAAQSIAWVAILDARGMELRDTWCEVKVFSLVGQAGQKQVKLKEPPKRPPAKRTCGRASPACAKQFSAPRQQASAAAAEEEEEKAKEQEVVEQVVPCRTRKRQRTRK